MPAKTRAKVKTGKSKAKKKKRYRDPDGKACCKQHHEHGIPHGGASNSGSGGRASKDAAADGPMTAEQERLIEARDFLRQLDATDYRSIAIDLLMRKLQVADDQVAQLERENAYLSETRECDPGDPSEWEGVGAPFADVMSGPIEWEGDTIVFSLV